jgi:hemerythrin superfamily protein
MNMLARRVAPDATSQIRADHTKVMAIFHRYRLDGRGRDRRALVDAACLSIEIHAQLEEEIFYPAMHAASDRDREMAEENVPDHDRMRELIARLRSTHEDDPDFDDDFMALMRIVIHHVAEEETMMLPDAERLLGPDRLDELGARMMRRRMQLMTPHASELVGNTVKAAPGATAMMVAGGLVGAALLARRAMAAR